MKTSASMLVSCICLFVAFFVCSYVRFRPTTHSSTQSSTNFTNR